MTVRPAETEHQNSAGNSAMQIPAAESRFPASETAKHSGSTDAGQILAGAEPQKTAAAEIARAVGSE